MAQVEGVEEGLRIGQEFGVVEPPVAILVGLAEPGDHGVRGAHRRTKRLAAGADEDIARPVVIVGGEGGRAPRLATAARHQMNCLRVLVMTLLLTAG